MDLTQSYLKKLFQAYYKAHSNEFPDPPSIINREFAFLSWDRPGMHRHLSYPSKDLLIQYLVRNGPRHSYSSAAYYKRPGADNMDKKGYLGCDFVVDIDADHIPTNCRERHNYNICKSCGFEKKGEKPKKCPQCGETKFDSILWICNECLDVSKKQVYNFVERFLIKEFQIGIEDIQLNFSGHRGYHIHIDNKKWRKLDSSARREIADYVTGEGFSYKLWNFSKVQNVMMGFTIDQDGWPGKVTRELYKILKRGNKSFINYFQEPIYGKKLNMGIIDEITKNRFKLLESIENNSRVWGMQGVGAPSWYRIFEIIRDKIKADIDVVVSIDLHRLIRLNGSLHGKSGFKVMNLEFDELKDFDPLVDSLSFPVNSSNKLKIQITSPICPKIRIADIEYGPYILDEKINLPLNTALFLLCKNIARLTN